MWRVKTMIEVSKLTSFLDSYLSSDKYDKDSNGLVFGDLNRKISKIAGVVNLSFHCINEIIEKKYDFVISHHAAWKSTDAKFSKDKYDLLSERNIGLYITHDSLDYHSEISTGISLANCLGWKIKGHFLNNLGVIAEPNTNLPNEICKQIEATLGARVEKYENNSNWSLVGIIPGWGARPEWIEAGMNEGINIFLSGEAIHFGKLYAYESSINLLLAGHYASEKPGIKNLLRVLGNNFAIKTEFIDDINSNKLF